MFGKPRKLVLTLAVGGSLVLVGFRESGRRSSAYADQSPNVVLFLADDMGWTDWQYDAVLNPTGSVVYETSNLLRLAQQSVIFNNAYAACPVCSPTRVSLLTGKTPARTRMTNFLSSDPQNTSATLHEPFNWVHNLPQPDITIAESLKSGGYATGFFGKWHAGEAVNASNPLMNGFDVNYGGSALPSPDIAGGYFAGSDGAWANMPGLDTPGTYAADKFLTDALAEKAADFIGQNASNNTPFFVMAADYAPHITLQAPQNLIDKYTTKIQTLQSQGVNIKDHNKPVYAALMEKLDQAVGTILHRLDDPNNDGDTSDSVRDNTIFIFTSDNGGAWFANGSPTRNLPLREGKGTLYEGGIREPLLVSWTGDPNMLPGGTISGARSSSYDLYPTIMDMTGLAANASVLKNANMDGVSIRNALEGQAFNRGNLYWHYPHRSPQSSTGQPAITGGSFVSAVENGDWKLLFFYDDRHYELYNLANDIGESTNVLNQNKDLARDMSTALRNYLLGVNALVPINKFTFEPVAAPPVVFLTGDYNGDGLVTIADYATWRSAFGTAISAGMGADGNANGIVDAADFVVWRNVFASGSGSAFSGITAAVPEPEFAVLLTVGSVLNGVRRRRRVTNESILLGA